MKTITAICALLLAVPALSGEQPELLHLGDCPATVTTPTGAPCSATIGQWNTLINERLRSRPPIAPFALVLVTVVMNGSAAVSIDMPSEASCEAASRQALGKRKGEHDVVDAFCIDRRDK